MRLRLFYALCARGGDLLGFLNPFLEGNSGVEARPILAAHVIFGLIDLNNLSAVSV